MIQILLHGMKMDPLVSLHYYAPVCAVINACIIPFTDGMAPIWNLHKVGILVLFTNAGIAFALNVSLISPPEKQKLNTSKTGGSSIPHLRRLRSHPHSCRCIERYPPHLRLGAGIRIAHHGNAGVWVFYQFERVDLVQDYWGQVKEAQSKEWKENAAKCTGRVERVEERGKKQVMRDMCRWWFYIEAGRRRLSGVIARKVPLLVCLFLFFSLFPFLFFLFI